MNNIFQKMVRIGRVSLSWILSLALLTGSLGPLPAARAGEGVWLPGEGVGVRADQVGLAGLTLDAEDPLRFHFIVNGGEAGRTGADLEVASARLVKYFFAALTVPEDDLWVNLAPQEAERVVPESFGRTRLGQDLLAQDYQLKQVAAGLLDPRSGLGQAFWQQVRARTGADSAGMGTAVDMAGKVWVMPDVAEVYAHGQTALIVNARLKVMSGDQYARLTDSGPDASVAEGPAEDPQQQVFQELILPAIEQEVNEGEGFAALRQIYQALILATWFKRNLKQGLLAQVYVGRNKIGGVDSPDAAAVEAIYQRYLAAYRQGAFELIHEDYDAASGQIVPRKYFSGGGYFSGGVMAAAVNERTDPRAASSAIRQLQPAGFWVDVRLDAAGADGRIIAPSADVVRRIVNGDVPGGMALLNGDGAGGAFVRDASGLYLPGDNGNGAGGVSRDNGNGAGPGAAAARLLARQGEKVFGSDILDDPVLAELFKWETRLQQILADEDKINRHPQARRLLGVIQAVYQDLDIATYQDMHLVAGVLPHMSQSLDPGFVEQDHLADWQESFETVVLAAGKQGLNPKIVQDILAPVGQGGRLDAEQLQESTLDETDPRIRQVTAGFKHHLVMDHQTVGGRDLERQYKNHFGLWVGDFWKYILAEARKRKAGPLLAKSFVRVTSAKDFAFLWELDQEIDLEAIRKVLSPEDVTLMVNLLEYLFYPEHLRVMVSDHRTMLLQALYRAYYLRRQFFPDEPFMTTHGVEILIDQRLDRATARQRGIILDMVREERPERFSDSQVMILIRNLIRYNEEGTELGRSLLTLAKERGLIDPATVRAQYEDLRSSLENLTDLSDAQYQDLLIKIQALPLSVLDLDMTFDVYPDDYGAGFEFEMQPKDGRTDDAIIAAYRAHFREIGFSWEAKYAGGEQVELTTPLYMFSIDYGKTFAEIFALALGNGIFAEVIKGITSTHYNFRIDGVLSRQAQGGMLRWAAANMALWYRMTRNPLQITNEDFHNSTLLDSEIFFPPRYNRARDYGKDRQVMNVRDNKFEVRMFPPPAEPAARQLDLETLKSHVNLGLALVRYAQRNPERLNMLYMPIPRLLGADPTPDADDTLTRKVLDELFADDPVGKLRALRLYHDPFWGRWRRYEKGAEDQRHIREEYFANGYGAVYFMHQAHSGYCRDVLGYLRQRLDKGFIDLENFDGYVFDLIGIIARDGTAEDQAALGEILTEKGLPWVLEVQGMELVRDLRRWLQGTDLISVTEKGRIDLLKAGLEDLADFVADKPFIWRNLVGMKNYGEELQFMVRLMRSMDTERSVYLFLTRPMPPDDMSFWVEKLLDLGSEEVHHMLFRLLWKIRAPGLRRRILSYAVQRNLPVDDAIQEVLEEILVSADEELATLSLRLLERNQRAPTELLLKLANGPLTGKVIDQVIETLMADPDPVIARQGQLLAVEKHTSLSVQRQTVDQLVRDPGARAGLLALVEKWQDQGRSRDLIKRQFLLMIDIVAQVGRMEDKMGLARWFLYSAQLSSADVREWMTAFLAASRQQGGGDWRALIRFLAEADYYKEVFSSYQAAITGYPDVSGGDFSIEYFQPHPYSVNSLQPSLDPRFAVGRIPFGLRVVFDLRDFHVVAQFDADEDGLGRIYEVQVFPALRKAAARTEAGVVVKDFDAPGRHRIISRDARNWQALDEGKIVFDDAPRDEVYDVATDRYVIDFAGDAEELGGSRSLAYFPGLGIAAAAGHAGVSIRAVGEDQGEIIFRPPAGDPRPISLQQEGEMLVIKHERAAMIYDVSSRKLVLEFDAARDGLRAIFEVKYLPAAQAAIARGAGGVIMKRPGGTGQLLTDDQWAGLRFSADGRMAAIQADGELILLDAGTGKMSRMNTANRRISDFAVTGGWVIFWGKDGAMARGIDDDRWQEVLPAPLAARSPDTFVRVFEEEERLLAWSGSRGKFLSSRDLTVIAEIDAEEAWITGGAYFPTADLLVVRTEKGLRGLNTKTGEAIVIAPRRAPEPDYVVSDDGQYLAVLGEEGMFSVIKDARTGRPLHFFPSMPDFVYKIRVGGQYLIALKDELFFVPAEAVDGPAGTEAAVASSSPVDDVQGGQALWVRARPDGEEMTRLAYTGLESLDTEPELAHAVRELQAREHSFVHGASRGLLAILENRLQRMQGGELLAKPGGFYQVRLAREPSGEILGQVTLDVDAHYPGVQLIEVFDGYQLRGIGYELLTAGLRELSMSFPGKDIYVEQIDALLLKWILAALPELEDELGGAAGRRIRLTPEEVQRFIAAQEQRLADQLRQQGLASSPVGSEQVGGMDFRPGGMDLRTHGVSSPLPAGVPGAEFWQSADFAGFVPVIVDVLPLGDLPAMLGIGAAGASP